MKTKKVWVLVWTVTKKLRVNTLLKMVKKSNFVLASSLKKVGESVKDLAKKAVDGKFLAVK